jgi:hypothetical protein
MLHCFLGQRAAKAVKVARAKAKAAGAKIAWTKILRVVVNVVLVAQADPCPRFSPCGHQIGEKC